MSRSCSRLLSVIAIASTSLPAVAQDTASSQDETGRKVGTMIEQAHQVYGPPAPTPACSKSKGDEIVVCAPDPGEQWRVPPTSETDPDSREAREALHDGLPRAPNVSGLPDCRSGCIGFGAAPPPIYIIDLSTIPEAPEGSDADKVAKGEMADR